jgi:hypothetical protein
VFVSGFAMDRKWSGFPTDPSGISIVFIQHIALGSRDALLNGSISLIAGERPPNLPIDPTDVQMSTVLGDSIEETVTPASLPSFPRSGVYTATAGEAGSWCISVRAADGEGSSEMIKGGSVPLISGIEHKVFDFNTAEDYADQLAAGVNGSPLYLPLLILALAALMAESWLASEGKPSKTKTPATATASVPTAEHAQELEEAA